MIAEGFGLKVLSVPFQRAQTIRLFEVSVPHCTAHGQRHRRLADGAQALGLGREGE